MRPLDALLPKTRQGILAATHGQPDKTWYPAELARRLGVPSSSLQRELERLTAAGILTAQRHGRMVHFQAHRESPLFSDLRGLLLKTCGLVDVLRESLAPIAGEIRVAFVHGSMVRGDEDNHSDVDLIVIGSVSSMELALPLREAHESLGRAVNPTVYTPAEFAQKRKAKDHFLTRVLATPKIFVIGDADELGKIAGAKRQG